MPWTLSKVFRFEASHQLPLHEGPCARLHGHSWQLTVEVRGDTLHERGSQSGMVLDYAYISQAVQPLLKGKLDHWHLNETTGLPHPTSEALARWMYAQLKPLLPELCAITLEETCTARCRYEPGESHVERDRYAP